MYEYEPYKLPAIEFVGGSRQDLKFDLFDQSDTPIDLTGWSAVFSVQAYAYRGGVPVFSDTMTLYPTTNPTALTIALPSDDTAPLCGKYIYQITIQDSGGRTIIPGKGVMYVSRNIDQSALDTAGA